MEGVFSPDRTPTYVGVKKEVVRWLVLQWLLLCCYGVILGTTVEHLDNWPRHLRNIRIFYCVWGIWSMVYGTLQLVFDARAHARWFANAVLSIDAIGVLLSVVFHSTCAYGANCASAHGPTTTQIAVTTAALEMLSFGLIMSSLVVRTQTKEGWFHTWIKLDEKTYWATFFASIQPEAPLPKTSVVLPPLPARGEQKFGGALRPIAGPLPPLALHPTQPVREAVSDPAIVPPSVEACESSSESQSEEEFVWSAWSIGTTTGSLFLAGVVLSLITVGMEATKIEVSGSMGMWDELVGNQEPFTQTTRQHYNHFLFDVSTITQTHIYPMVQIVACCGVRTLPLMAVANAVQMFGFLTWRFTVFSMGPETYLNHYIRDVPTDFWYMGYIFYDLYVIIQAGYICLRGSTQAVNPHREYGGGNQQSKLEKFKTGAAGVMLLFPGAVLTFIFQAFLANTWFAMATTEQTIFCLLVMPLLYAGTDNAVRFLSNYVDVGEGDVYRLTYYFYFDFTVTIRTMAVSLDSISMTLLVTGAYALMELVTRTTVHFKDRAASKFGRKLGWKRFASACESEYASVVWARSTICGVIAEIYAIIFASCGLLIVRLKLATIQKEVDDAWTYFVYSLLIQLAMEFLSDLAAIFIEARYFSLPITKIWFRDGKGFVAAVAFCAATGLVWASDYRMIILVFQWRKQHSV